MRMEWEDLEMGTGETIARDDREEGITRIIKPWIPLEQGIGDEVMKGAGKGVRTLG
jgi:hypothetical protein